MIIKSLEITVKIGCPLDCGFCPQSKLKTAYSGEREFTMETFVKCLATVPKDIRLDFSGFAEPFIHHDIGHMACWVSQKGYKIHIFTTLVGLSLTKLAAIKECGIESVRIHVPDMKAMVIPDDKWIALHRIWQQSGLVATYMSMGELTPKVADYLKSLNIVVEMPEMLSRGGNLWKPRHLDGEIRCAANRWHQNVLLPNGDVVACCMNYDLSMNLGNLLRKPYCEIEAKANEYEANSNPPANSICRDCEWSAPL
jgi:radical SAM protein with 4Fe4S-binding SPASM domain